MDDGNHQPLLGQESVPRSGSTPLLGDSLEREGRGWLGEERSRSRQASPSPSTLVSGPTQAYSEEFIRQMLKRSQSTATMREARGR
jgi:hypothetical protein